MRKRLASCVVASGFAVYFYFSCVFLFPLPPLCARVCMCMSVSCACVRSAPGHEQLLLAAEVDGSRGNQHVPWPGPSRGVAVGPLAPPYARGGDLAHSRSANAREPLALAFSFTTRSMQYTEYSFFFGNILRPLFGTVSPRGYGLADYSSTAPFCLREPSAGTENLTAFFFGVPNVR